jgi:hypothetical protein
MIRLAIYYTPDTDSPLAVAAAQWLGRDVLSSGQHLPKPALSLPPERHMEIIATPFHYGFHGTIKPPFRLADGVTVEQVGDRLHEFTRRFRQFILPPLTVTYTNDFFCLQPTAPCPDLSHLAAETVKTFDAFRRVPEAAELRRRRSAGLTSQQKQLLRVWGYPYLMDEFRFHLTLTGKISDSLEKKILEEELQKRFEPHLLRGIPFCSLALFIEEDNKEMHLLRRFSLA